MCKKWIRKSVKDDALFWNVKPPSDRNLPKGWSTTSFSHLGAMCEIYMCSLSLVIPLIYIIILHR
jgi:hypothetical protein